MDDTTLRTHGDRVFFFGNGLMSLLSAFPSSKANIAWINQNQKAEA